MEQSKKHERPQGSEASVDQRPVGHDEQVEGEGVRIEEIPRVDPIRQLQEAMIRMAEGQAEFFGRQPVQPVSVQRTEVDVNM